MLNWVTEGIKSGLQQEAYGFYGQFTGTPLPRDSDGYIVPGPDQGQDDALEAFRHAYASARVAQLTHQYIAEYTGNYNEIGPDHLNDPYVHRMSLWNNEVARRLEGQYGFNDTNHHNAETLAEMIYEALENGDLVTDPRDPRLQDLYKDDPRLQLPLDDPNRKELSESDVEKINQDIKQALDKKNQQNPSDSDSDSDSNSNSNSDSHSDSDPTGEAVFIPIA